MVSAVCGVRAGQDLSVRKSDIRASLGVLATFFAGEAAQDVVEYGLLIATVAFVVLLGITAFGNQIRPWFEQLAARITTVGT